MDFNYRLDSIGIFSGSTNIKLRFARFHFALVFITDNAIKLRSMICYRRQDFCRTIEQAVVKARNSYKGKKILITNCSALKETKHSPAGEGILMKYFLVIIIALACRDLPSLQFVFMFSTACQNSKGASLFFSNKNCLNHAR